MVKKGKIVELFKGEPRYEIVKYGEFYFISDVAHFPMMHGAFHTKKEAERFVKAISVKKRKKRRKLRRIGV